MNDFMTTAEGPLQLDPQMVERLRAVHRQILILLLLEKQ